MNKKVLILILALTSAASAKQLSPQEIRSRLQLHADIYLLDQSGKKILSGPETTNYWRAESDSGVISGGWSSRFEDGSIVLRQNWKVEDNGSIKAVIEEFQGEFNENNGERKYKNLLEKKEFVLENFEPIVWKVKGIEKHKYIVRLIPSLREVSKPISVDSLPIAGSGVSISDNLGFLWADGLYFNGKYSGVTTHRGTIAVSYSPFEGAKEMGSAEGSEITLNVDSKFQIKLKSATSFLPSGITAKVYAVYLPDKKSTGFNSVHSFDSNKEARIQEVLKSSKK